MRKEMTVKEKRKKVLDLLESGPEWFYGGNHCSCIIGATAEILGLEIDHRSYRITLSADDVINELRLIPKAKELLLLNKGVISLKGPEGARKAAKLLKDSFLPISANLVSDESADSGPEQRI